MLALESDIRIIHFLNFPTWIISFFIYNIKYTKLFLKLLDFILALCMLSFHLYLEIQENENLRNTNRRKGGKNTMRSPMSKDRQCNLNRGANNMSPWPRFWKCAFNFNQFRSQATLFSHSLLFIENTNSYTCNLVPFYDKEGNLHLIISYNIFSNVLAHLSSTIFSYSVFLKARRSNPL